MAHSKCPLIGDPVYGPAMNQRLSRLKAAGYKLPSEAITFLQGFRRQALHALGLRLIHPRTQEVMEFETDLPDDIKTLETLLDSLTIKP
jgi:23S rRNA pseudouridine1911/1915/1917 synthase